MTVAPPGFVVASVGRDGIVLVEIASAEQAATLRTSLFASGAFGAMHRVNDEWVIFTRGRRIALSPILPVEAAV